MPSQNAAPDLQTVVTDLRDEGQDLYTLLSDMDTGFWTQKTSFKNWSIWDVVAHLHFSDYMALTSVRDSDAFRALGTEMRANGMRAYTENWLRNKQNHAPTGPELLDRWWTMFANLCDTLSNADPEQRFVWAGPGMKAKMFATARQMETWAHGWEVYDLMSRPRQHHDRLINIATIGVRTFGWTFRNRSLPVPETEPYVQLESPSGASWTWNNEDSADRVRGSAVEFCQVVTQVRNIADTTLEVQGDTAHAWMEIAQCFAGPPETPPRPGSRTQLKSS